MSNFWQRAITGTIFVIVLVGAIVMSGWYVHALFGLIVLLGLIEFYGLFSLTPVSPQKITGTALGFGLYLSVVLAIETDSFLLLFASFAIILIGLILISILELFRNREKPFENIAITYIGIFYLAIPFTLLDYLNTRGAQIEFINGKIALTESFWLPLSIFILVWSNDTFAYLTGKLIGKHKLFERVSPKKTWEGFIGGIVFAVLSGIILAYFLEWSYLKMITYGIVVGIIGTAGDLVESMLKRSVGVKDSGNILPGHGGILDRFDAVLFVVPVIFYLEMFIFVNY